MERFALCTNDVTLSPLHPFRALSPLPVDPSLVPNTPPSPPSPITLAQLQQWIRELYLEKDLARGLSGTFIWFMEEVGELAAALRSGSHEERVGEFADVLAWLATMANVAGVDLGEAVRSKYGSGCPGCGQLRCVCDGAAKP